MKKRTLITILVAAAVLLIAVPEALAAAGGGSAGFGGGGGGGEGGHGGRGFLFYVLFQLLLHTPHAIGAIVLVAVILLLMIYGYLAPKLRGFTAAHATAGPSATKRTTERRRRVSAAAAEAAEDDPEFSADAVQESAARLFMQIQAAWDNADRQRLSRLVAPELMTEWERRLDDFQRHGWRNRVQVIGPPTIEYVGLEHRGDAQRDRVTVRVQATLRDYVEDGHGRHIMRTGGMTEKTRIREFWTLSRRNGHWVLSSIEQGAEGAHALTDQIVATPWSDEQGLHDEAMIGLAVADALPKHVAVADIADLEFEGDARAAALDLSLADARFSPDVLEIAARQAVNAWAEAVDGPDARLKTLATPAAVQQLLHPGDPSQRTRLVVRGPKVKRIRIERLDPASKPPRMTIAVDLEGRRYVQDRDTTAVIAGSQWQLTTFTEHWTLALRGDERLPWRIVSA